MAGAQLLDIGWGALIITGAERVSVDPALPGSALVLEHMPWTHSLPGSLVWSLAAALAARRLLRLPLRAAVMIGLVVFSHWILDFLVHRPDLALWPGGPKVGLGLWNLPVLEQAVEMGLLGLAAAAWAWARAREGRSLWPVLTFLTFLVGLQSVGLLLPPPASSAALGANAIGAYLIAAALAWLVERSDRSPTTGLRGAAPGA